MHCLERCRGSPYKKASVAYLVDKTDLTVNKALCRYAGDVDTTGAAANVKSCEGLYELEQFGHAQNGDAKHTGYEFKGTDFANNDANSELGTKYNNDDEHHEEPAGTAAEAGGEFWARVTHQDPYIQESRGVRMDDLLRPDIEYMSAFAIAAYTRVINDNVRYTPQTAAGRGAQLGHVDEGTDLSPDQQDNRAALLDAIPGTCFSPGVSGSLLYSEGWGAAYFSLGILLVVAHLLWLAAAMMGESMEMVRFNAKRAMSFLGILVGLIGLCTFAPQLLSWFRRGPPVNHCPLPFPTARPALLYLRLWSGRDHRRRRAAPLCRRHCQECATRHSGNHHHVPQAPEPWPDERLRLGLVHQHCDDPGGRGASLCVRIAAPRRAAPRLSSPLPLPLTRALPALKDPGLCHCDAALLRQLHGHPGHRLPEGLGLKLRRDAGGRRLADPTRVRAKRRPLQSAAVPCRQTERRGFSSRSRFQSGGTLPPQWGLRST